jgi:hypothetical protein
MATVREITAFDWVELLEEVDGIPAGARGGVLELHADDTAMLEIMSMPELDAAERIIFAPVSKLRVVDPPSDDEHGPTGPR